MKIKYTDEFKEGYLRIIATVSNSARFYNNLNEVVRLIEQEYKLSPAYTVNAIRGQKGWYNCYVYNDTKDIVILQYKVSGGYSYLLRIDFIEAFIDFN